MLMIIAPLVLLIVWQLGWIKAPRVLNQKPWVKPKV
jgi:hypothetical protein